MGDKPLNSSLIQSGKTDSSLVPNKSTLNSSELNKSTASQAPEKQEKKKFDKNEAKHESFDKYLRDIGAHKKREQNKSWITDVYLPLEVRSADCRCLTSLRKSARK